MFDFKLDFSKYVPYQFCPSQVEASALYLQCIAQAPMDIEFRKVRDGIYNIMVMSEADKNKLEGKALNYEWGVKTHILRSARIPLVLQKKRQLYKNPKWITVDKLYDGPLRFVANEDLDTYFKQYGTIIVDTHDEKDKFGFRTGRKKLRLDLDTDIKRWQEIELDVAIEGIQKVWKSKVNIYYFGQPYHCRACEDVHTSKCPQRVAKEQADKVIEVDRISKVKTLLIGDSNLRRVNEQAFYAKTDCATGAKIGHISNSLEYVKKDEYEVVTVHAGQNNVLQDETVNMEEWGNQMQKEVNCLKNNLGKFKKSIIVGVPPAPWCKSTAQTKLMRTQINDAFRKVTRDNLNISFLEIEQETEDDDANWEDNRHMTEKFTAYMLGKVANRMSALKVDPFVAKNTPWTVERKHSGVRNTYFLGCEVCTVTGHDKDTCPGFSSRKRRDKPSGSGESESKAPKV